MGFLRRLFGQGDDKKGGRRTGGGHVDEHGIYFYVECGRCRKRLRLRADKRYDLNNTPEGTIEWHKTVVCTKCFRQMPATVLFDGNRQVASQEISGGRFISAEEDAQLAAAEAEAARRAAEADDDETTADA